MSASTKVVVVTGASSGFGRLTAEFLARQGHRVFATMRELAGRNGAVAEALRELGRREGLKLQAAELDMTQDASVESCVRLVLAETGRIDVLVNNAGFGYRGLQESFTPEQALRILDTNVVGVHRTIRAVLPQMHRQREGLLIQVSSGAGRVVLPGMGLYCASKFALEALSECYRYELAGSGIDVVCLQPGAYPTEIFGKLEPGGDAGRESAYGAARELAPRIGGALSASTADPMDVPNLLLDIIETPAGSRAARYTVGHRGEGVNTINSVCAEVQEQVLVAMGVAELTRFAKDGPA